MRGLGIFGLGQDHLHGQGIVRSKTQRDVVQGDHGADQQARSSQQDQGKRDLRGDQGVVGITPRPQADRSRGGPLRQYRAEAETGCPPGGYHAKEQSGQDRDPQGETQHPQVDTGLLQPWDIRGTQADPALDRDRGQQQSQNTARDTEQEVLGEHWTHHTHARGAQGHTHGRLILSGHGPGQEQIGDIGAGDQQHQSRASQQQQR